MWLFIVSSTVVLLDQLAKRLISDKLQFNESIKVIDGFFNLTLVHNPGAAFGLFPHHKHLFIVFSIVTAATIFFIYLKYARNNTNIQILLGLILGGAIGNLIDRLYLGYVVDFLDFYLFSYHWPAFNIADSSICIGVGLITLVLLKEQQG